MCASCEQSIDDFSSLVDDVQILVSRDIFYPVQHAGAAEELDNSFKHLVIRGINEVEVSKEEFGCVASKGLI